MHGKGIYTWPNGKKYVGAYVKDKKEGLGVYTWPDGREYSGSWKDGKQDGVGRFKSKDGVVKSGMWEKGKRTQWISLIGPDGKITPIDEDAQGEEDTNVPPSVINPKKDSHIMKKKTDAKPAKPTAKGKKK